MHFKSQKKPIRQTYLKYIFSYLIIVVILVLGTFFIIKNQLTKRFFEQRADQIQQQLSYNGDWLNSTYTHIKKMDSSLAGNITLIQSLYTRKEPHKYYALQELSKYDSTMLAINSIMYKPRNSANVISTNHYTTFDGTVFHIHTSNFFSPSDPLEFDPAPYLGSNIGQIILISDEFNRQLLYLPSTNSVDDAVMFLGLDHSEIEQKLKSLLSAELTGLALVDKNKKIAVDVNGELLIPYMDSFEYTSGIHSMDASNSICVHSGIWGGFSLVALISQDSLRQQVNAAFATSYTSMILLCIVGLLSVFFAMRITYTPIHRLTKKLLPDAAPIKDNLKELEYIFSKKDKQNQMLAEKLDSYRLFMQKSLLGSLIDQHSLAEINDSPNIDQFFEKDANNEIFIIQMMSPARPLLCQEIQAYFKEILPGKDNCIILEKKSDRAFFLINFSGLEMHKNTVLKELLQRCYEEKGYLSAISKGTESPLDIPSLYESVLHASLCWPDVPVVEYKSLSPIANTFDYPYSKLHQLTELLTEMRFDEARNLVGEIFRFILNSVRSESTLPDFFLRCILVDIMTIFANCMNKAHIDFEIYEAVYTETLYFCRSCSYQEKAKEIEMNIDCLVDIYEQQISNRALTPAQVIQLMETSYSQPDFSIVLLADKCRVSQPYMSYLFKKELNQSFTDYLWSLRLKKAKELLINSDMSIDEVSVEVGYLNPSSFRRKFKQETTFTPSEFRKKNRINLQN